MAGHLTLDLEPKRASAVQKQLMPQMWEQARAGTGGYNSSTVFRKHWFGLIICYPSCCHDSHHRQRTLNTTKPTQITVKWKSRVFTFRPQVCRTIWHSEFIGDVGLVSCCLFGGGDVGRSRPCHAECFTRVFFSFKNASRG